MSRTRTILAAAMLAAATAADGAGQNGQPPPAGELLPLDARQRTFVVSDGPDAGNRLPLMLRQADEGAAWELELEGMNTMHLLERDDGSVVIDRLDVRAERETVFYEPPVVLLPGAVEPDRRWTSEGRAQVYDWDMGAIEHRGTYQHEVKPVSRLTLSTPAGRFQALLVETDQTVDLQAPAEVRIRLDTAYVPDVGIVQRSMTFTIDKPAWFGDTRRRTIRLAEPVRDDAAG